jgi:hypothetical protein
MQENEVEPLPNIIYKNELKMDQRLKHKIQKYKNFRRKHRESLYDIRFGKGFLDMISKPQARKEKVGKLDLIKIKISYAPKDTIKCSEMEEIFANHISDKTFISRINKAVAATTT